MNTLRKFILGFFAFQLIILALSNQITTISDVSEYSNNEPIIVLVHQDHNKNFLTSNNNSKGFEIEIINLLSQKLNTKVRIIKKKKESEILSLLKNNKAHIGFLRTNSNNNKKLLVSPTLLSDHVSILYIKNKHLNMKEVNYSNFEINLNNEKNMNFKILNLDFIYKKLLSKEIKIAYIDNYSAALYKHFYPNIKIKKLKNLPFDLRIFSHSFANDLLKNDLLRFFNEIVKSGELQSIKDKYYGHLNALSNEDIKIIHKKYKILFKKKYINIFKKNQKTIPVDWRLLSALSYQESRWNNDAISPTGVKGLMMLTLPTAKRLGIRNRNNPESSIEGAFKYVKILKKSLPDSIYEPDRTWFAIAAYNIGLGHIKDSRNLALDFQLNPNKWHDLRKVLPLLTKKKFYKKLPRGYARGYETIFHTERVRSIHRVINYLSS